MSDNWKVHLTFTDAKSNKFWRGRTDGSTMYVNYGRIGSDGQTSVKEFGSPGEAESALDKQANSKRKKGYVDEAGGSAPAAAAPAAPVGLPEQAANVAMTLDSGGRSIELSLSYDGKVVRTEVAETYVSAEEAAAAFVRIQQALASDGYKTKA